MSASRAIDNLDLEYAERDSAEVPLFEEEAASGLSRDVVAGIDLDPELAGLSSQDIVGYDPFF